MGVNTSQKSDDITTKDFTYYTGVIPYKIVAVNPNLSQLKEMGIDYLQNEPQYLGTNFDETKKQMLVRFYMENRPFKCNGETVPEGTLKNMTVDFRITEGHFVGSNTGKGQYVNKYGRTAWAMPDDTAALGTNKYFVNDDARPSSMGEEDLYKFIFAWANMVYDPKGGKMDDCRLNAEKILSGDVSEIREVIKQLETYTIKVLTGFSVVKNDKGELRVYYKTYSKYFLKHNQESLGYFQKFVNKLDDKGEARNAFKQANHYTWDIENHKQHEAFMYFAEKDQAPAPVITDSTSGTAPADKKEDDLPF